MKAMLDSEARQSLSLPKRAIFVVRVHMRLCLSLALFLALAHPAYSAETQSAEVVEAGKRLDFIADVSKFQGMFDSVVEFCRPYAPEHLAYGSMATGKHHRGIQCVKHF